MYHMTILLFNGKRHVINNVMTTRYITLLAGASNVRYNNSKLHGNKQTLETIKIAFKSSYDKHNLTLVIITY